tara:strand:+ start:1676 stop:2278 length:603 start_codon:yes stop_codon:yes gene_type:complete
MKKEGLDSKKLKASKFYTKICTRCGVTKKVNDFHWKVLDKRLSAECSVCAIDRDNNRYSASIHTYIKMLIKNKISDCKRGKRNKFISLNHFSFFKIWKDQFSKFGVHCPYSGVEMTHQRGEGKISTNASIDRFDSSLGYIPGNVVFCTNLTNSMKLDMDFEDFLIQCQIIVANKVDHSKIREYMQNLQGLRTTDHGPEDE